MKMARNSALISTLPAATDSVVHHTAAHRHAEHSSYFPTRRQIFSRYIFKYFSKRLQLYSRHQDRGLRGYMAVITAPGLPTKLDNNFVQPCI